MHENIIKLTQGDWIIHSRYGLGQVVGVEEKTLEDSKQSYYNVKTDSFSYWLSSSNLESGRIRRIAGSEEFSQALNLISTEPVNLDENFRNRMLAINDLITENSILSKAQLIRDMHARNVRKDIHANERGILDLQKDQFVEEFVISCQIPENTARDQIRAALAKSSENIKPKKPAF
jgi:RNA polymerase-interacting CarD/CdnL/TRCF family regulator